VLFNRAGNRIPGVTPNFLFARLGYDQPDGALKGLGGFVEVNFRDAFYVDNANLLKAPGFAIVNLEAHWDPRIKIGAVSKLRAFFEVQNLFNKTYVASANNIADTLASNGQQNGASVLAATGGSIYAGAPRTFFAGVRIAL
jgi:iron complex outermembrane receptor protein